jgi:positive regulator of sigma E activity
MTKEHRDEVVGRLLSFLSKKFIMALLIFIVSTVFVALDKIDGLHWLGIMVSDLLGYNFANSYTKKHKN